MEEFHKLTSFIHRDQFDLFNCRNWIDAYLLHQVIKFQQPANVLEIGYYEGFSFGVIYETIKNLNLFTSCDIDYTKDKFRKIVDVNNCVFVNDASTNLTLDREYDFINIDGYHHYDPVISELKLCTSHLSPTGLLMVDDYISYKGVDQALQEFIPDSGLLPVLVGHQQIFFSKTELDPEFKKNIINSSKLFVSWTSTDYQSHSDVLTYRAKHVSIVSKFPEILTTITKK